MTKVGDVSRCLQCGGKIVAIHDPSIISLSAGLWIHKGSVRRAFQTHRPVPPC